MSRRAPTAADGKRKTIYQLESPFTAPAWPDVSPELQDTMLELLCSLLAPIGHHRRTHAMPSQGRRARKRQRTEAQQTGIVPDATPPVPARPEISRSVVVGLNSITRHLERLSQHATRRPASPIPDPGPDAPTREPPGHRRDDVVDVQHVSAIFLPSSAAQASVLAAHLPALAHTASLAHPSLPPTRLVPLSSNSEARLCAALGVPRVSFVGLLEDAPHAGALMKVVRDALTEVKVGWLEEAGKAEYRRVRIEAVDPGAGAGAGAGTREEPGARAGETS